jgi:transposase InsO family protein
VRETRRLLLALPGRWVRLIEVEARVAAQLDLDEALFQVRASPVLWRPERRRSRRHPKAVQNSASDVNPRWGYTRIRGALMNLGYEVGRNMIKRVLAENGIDPVGCRPIAWKTFLRAHWGAIAATDFFTVEVVTWRGLVRYFVLFVIDLKSRRVEIAGITAMPNGEWMRQVARNLVDCEEGFLANSGHLIHDRDPLFTHAFAGTLKRAGGNPVKLPIRSPKLNAYAERFIRSAKSECVGQVIPVGERHLWRVVSEYVAHYHRERNHQGIGNRLIDRGDGNLGGTGPIECHERLGRVLRYYARAA